MSTPFVKQALERRDGAGEALKLRRGDQIPRISRKGSGELAVEFNRALRNKRSMHPGPGRWVEYILPDLRRVYVEANTRVMRLGSSPSESLSARVVIKPGATEYTTYLKTLIFMRNVLVFGDMHDVVRTADKVGLQTEDPETELAFSAAAPRDDRPLVVRAVSDTMSGIGRL